MVAWRSPVAVNEYIPMLAVCDGGSSYSAGLLAFVPSHFCLNDDRYVQMCFWRQDECDVITCFVFTDRNDPYRNDICHMSKM